MDTHGAVEAMMDVELALRKQAVRCNNDADRAAWTALATQAYLLRAALEGLLNGCSTQIPPGFTKPQDFP